VIRELHQVDSNVDKDSIVNSSFLFSDFEINTLHSVRGEVQTTAPYKYYGNVEDLQQYCQKLAEINDESEDYLLSKDFYNVDYWLETWSDETDEAGNSIPKKSVRDDAEELMAEFISETFTTDWEYLTESESVILGEPEFESGRRVSFWVRIPIVGEEIGVTR
jgi:hypothetical protein